MRPQRTITLSQIIFESSIYKKTTCQSLSYVMHIVEGGDKQHIPNPIISPLTKWVRIPVSYNNKTDIHDFTEILLKVAINTMTLTLRSGWKRLILPPICHESDNLYYIMLYLIHRAMSGTIPTTLVVIGTSCIGSCKSYYYTITTTTTSCTRSWCNTTVHRKLMTHYT
jgi:hypothetical protein